jgi:hypothetical protein
MSALLAKIHGLAAAGQFDLLSGAPASAAARIGLAVSPLA